MMQDWQFLTNGWKTGFICSNILLYCMPFWGGALSDVTEQLSLSKKEMNLSVTHARGGGRLPTQKDVTSLMPSVQPTLQQ